MSHGLCVGQDPDMFFERSRYDEGVAICEACALKFRCRRYAVEHHEYGVWGGWVLLRGRRSRTYRDLPVEEDVCSDSGH